MKKQIMKAGSISLGITTLMGIINYILGTMFGKIIGFKFWGGDASFTYGFSEKFINVINSGFSNAGNYVGDKINIGLGM